MWATHWSEGMSPHVRTRIATVCPSCGLGILRVIDSRFGPFWGCTEYGSKQSCRYKRDIASGIHVESRRRRQ